MAEREKEYAVAVRVMGTPDEVIKSLEAAVDKLKHFNLANKTPGWKWLSGVDRASYEVEEI